MSEHLKEISAETFNATIKESAQPVLVDFWAPWCGPCRMLAPIIERVAGANAGRLVAVKLNVDEAPEIAARYGIRSIPTVMLFKGGDPVEAVVGALPERELTNLVAKHV